MRVIWVDDQWAEGMPEQASLSCALKYVIEEMEKNGLTPIWDCEQTAGDSFVQIDRKGQQYALAILDVKLGAKTKTVIEDLIKKLKEKKIHFVIYSNHIEDDEIQKLNLSDERLCLGTFAKGNDSERLEPFIQAIVNFLIFPPIRLVHATDLHFDSRAASGGDRSKLIRSLTDTLYEIHKEKKIDALLFSGDFAFKNPAADLPSLRSDLQQLFEKVGIQKDSLFFVPGNHDIMWDDFEGKSLASNPYLYYLELLNGLGRKYFTSREKEAFAGYKKIGTSHTINSDDLSWHRHISTPQIDLIGISTVALTPALQGKGVFSDTNLNYVQREWASSKNKDELRVLLMHHNLMSVHSLSTLDDQDIAQNAGAALTTLLEAKCDLVICGHTHRSEVINYHASFLGHTGFSKENGVVVIAGGASGGRAATMDFPRSIHVIDISRIVKTQDWNIEVTPFLYDSRNAKWDNKDSVNTLFHS